MVWESARVAAAAAAVLFLPGWLLLDVTPWNPLRGARVSLIPTAFALSVATVTVLGMIGHLVGAGLVLVLSMIVVLDGMALVRIAAALIWHAEKPASRLSTWVRGLERTDTVVAGFAALAAGAAAWAGVWFSRTADTFYHLAVVRRLINHDELLAGRVIYADSVSAELPSGLDPTSGTWHLALALIAKMSGLDIVDVWALLPPLMALLLVLAFYTLAAVLLQNRWWALAATVIQFTLFTDMDFRTSLYPNVIAKAILWIGLAAAFRYAWRGDRKGLAVAGAMVFALASIHTFAAELYFLSLGALAAASLLLVRWRSHLQPDLGRLAVLIGSGLALALPMVFARAQGAGLVSISDVGTDEYGAFANLGSALEEIPMSGWLGDTVLSPITSLGISEWAADHLSVYRRSALGYSESISPETATFLLVLLLLPGLFRGRRLNVFLISTTAVVPLVALNPLVVTYVSPRVDDIALLRLPQIVPYALIWVAVLAPLASRLGRLALRHRPKLAWRYASASARRWLPPGRLRQSVPTPAFVAVGGLLAGAIVAATSALGTAGIDDGLFNRYLESEDTIYSVQDSKATALHYDEGVFAFLRNNAPPDAIVLADAVSSYYISGFVGTPVVAVPWKHSPRRVERDGGAQRRQDVADALSGGSLRDALRVVREYRVAYVVTNASGSTLFAGLPDLFRVVYDDSESRVYEYLGAHY